MVMKHTRHLPNHEGARSERPQTSTNIDEAMIGRLVHDFYAAVRQDELLGPIFAANVGEWGPHLERICAFWSSVTLKSGVYRGQPMQKHLPLPIDSRHFDRWLELFVETAERTCPAEVADCFAGYARRIAESLELGVAGANKVLLGKGERLRRSDLD